VGRARELAACQPEGYQLVDIGALKIYEMATTGWQEKTQNHHVDCLSKRWDNLSIYDLTDLSNATSSSWFFYKYPEWSNEEELRLGLRPGGPECIDGAG
jgi:hypothetical protein